MRFQLSAEDRERLGCPDVLEFDLDKLMMREVIALKTRGWTPKTLSKALAGTPAVDDNGRVVYATDADGKDIRDGQGRKVQARDVDLAAVLPVVWLALARAGVTVDYDTLDFNINGFEMLDDPDGGEPGKA